MRHRVGFDVVRFVRRGKDVCLHGRYSTKEVVKLMEEIGFPPSIAATFQVTMPSVLCSSARGQARLLPATLMCVHTRKCDSRLY